MLVGICCQENFYRGWDGMGWDGMVVFLYRLDAK